mmetsp:Transcript_2970/g.4556  ORF Transcript_2970/g.4556 Transcript_2970/m.4556 type:complete len:219 (-) Transcript_2970:2734-3390(-)
MQGLYCLGQVVPQTELAGLHEVEVWGLPLVLGRSSDRHDPDFEPEGVIGLMSQHLVLVEEPLRLRAELGPVVVASGIPSNASQDLDPIRNQFVCLLVEILRVDVEFPHRCVGLLELDKFAREKLAFLLDHHLLLQLWLLFSSTSGRPSFAVRRESRGDNRRVNPALGGHGHIRGGLCLDIVVAKFSNLLLVDLLEFFLSLLVDGHLLLERTEGLLRGQ